MAGRDDLLIAEYNNCAELANHIDNVRNVITSFFLTINGGVLIVLTVVLKGEVDAEAVGSPKALLAGVLVMVFVLGTLFTGTVARLRRIQSERYWVANGILDYFLKDEHRRIVGLESAQLAQDSGGKGLGRRSTGSYMWSLAIMLPTSALAGLATYVIVADINDWGPSWAGWPLAALALLVAFVFEDGLYFRLSTFRPAEPAEGETQSSSS